MTMAAPADGTPVVVPTTHGALRGEWKPRHRTFRRSSVRGTAGRRAAVPATRPAEPWDGERDATAFGPVSPQNPSLMDALFGGEAEHGTRTAST